MSDQSETGPPRPVRYMIVGLIVILVVLTMYADEIVGGLVVLGLAIYAILHPQTALDVLSKIAALAGVAVAGVAVGALVCLIVGFGASKMFEVTPDG